MTNLSTKVNLASFRYYSLVPLGTLNLVVRLDNKMRHFLGILPMFVGYDFNIISFCYRLHFNSCFEFSFELLGLSSLFFTFILTTCLHYLHYLFFLFIHFFLLILSQPFLQFIYLYCWIAITNLSFHLLSLFFQEFHI